VLQPKEGSRLLLFAESVSDCPAQQWLKHAEGTIQHVGSGLCLDTEVQYDYHLRGQPWESCGSVLSLQPRDGSQRQQWVLAACKRGSLLRHAADGRALDVNFWQVQCGQGVNVNVAHSTAAGALFVLEDLREPLRKLRVLNVPRDELSWAAAAAAAADAGARLPTVEEVVEEREHCGEEGWIPVSGCGSDAWIETSESWAVRLSAEQPEVNCRGDVPECGEGCCSLIVYDVAGPGRPASTEEKEAILSMGEEEEFRIKPAVCTKPSTTPLTVDFERLRSVGRVAAVWLVEKHDGNRFVLHNHADGSYQAYHLNSSEEVDKGCWSLQDGKYTQETSFAVEGVLHGDANSCYMDVDCGPHGYHKYVLAQEAYHLGYLAENAPEFDFCLGVRSNGYTGDEHEVYLEKTDGSAGQRWRLVGKDSFQHVASGRFLHTPLQYAFVGDVRHPWEGNHTHLVTRPRDGSAAQRWVLEAPPAGCSAPQGGKILRHFADGRAVDVHGWDFKPEQNMGCENSTHGNCRGVTFIFETATLPTSVSSL